MARFFTLYGPGAVPLGNYDTSAGAVYALEQYTKKHPSSTSPRRGAYVRADQTSDGTRWVDAKGHAGGKIVASIGDDLGTHGKIVGDPLVLDKPSKGGGGRGGGSGGDGEDGAEKRTRKQALSAAEADRLDRLEGVLRMLGATDQEIARARAIPHTAAPSVALKSRRRKPEDGEDSAERRARGVDKLRNVPPG